MRKSKFFLCLTTLIIFASIAGFRPVQSFAQSGNLTISNVNQTASSIPQYEKLEIAFSIGSSVATNLQWPCDTSQTTPTSGAWALSTGVGISTDGVFRSPGGKVLRQPAFWYVPYNYVNLSGSDWIYPAGAAYWLIRFAPQEQGNWSYHLEARDGATCQNAARYPSAGEINFSVSPPLTGSHGFLKVSQTDKRYFEYSDGKPFVGLGHEWSFPYLSSALADLTKFHTYGVNFIRIWFDSDLVWSRGIHGWDAWRNADNLRNTTERYANSDFSIRLSGNNSYIFETSDGNQFNTGAIESAKKYKIRIRAKLANVTAASGTQPNGLVAKLVLDPSQFNSQLQLNFTPTGFVGNDTSWRVYEGPVVTNNLGRTTFSYGSALVLGLQNVTSGSTAYVDEIYIGEDLGTSEPATLSDLSPGLGPSVVYKGKFNYHQGFDQLASYKWDRTFDTAKQNQVFLKLVASDIRDIIVHCINQTAGTFITDQNLCNDDNFMSYRGAKARRLQEYYWRYLIARWGYTPAIHSWELTNEGDPGSAAHLDNTNQMAESFQANDPNKHMITTSFWGGLNTDYFNNPATPIDYGDTHAYRSTTWIGGSVADAKDPIVRSSCGSNQTCYLNWLNGDTALWHAEHSLIARQWVPNLPLIRGETGLGLNCPSDPNCWSRDDPKLAGDTRGVWLHDFLWSQVNPGGLYDLYWWTENIITKIGPDGSSDNGLWEIYKPFRDFMDNIPLTNGKYQDAQPAISNNNTLIAYGQKNLVNRRAHLWIRNRKHSWCAVVGGVSGCSDTWDSSRMSGTVTIAGFAANVSYPIEWWQFDSIGTLTKTSPASLMSNSSGQIILNLDGLPATVTDIGVKVGDYSQGTPPTPTPTPTVAPKQILVSWLTGVLDQNGDGKVNSIDFAKILLR
ncbi:hypothetical protein A2627_01970 [Candidatus Woesebacteria bacterium RIFCSPHIGHO2_01_FULL_39_28]|uniref:DUF5060 domain-containing protein n=1 Tax=Candidatus Woesebacteria bacterium RIFCSPHIGHO2_01_FULL_39_28 TaxID=1802496 RepID=A0A1F7YLW4_9BACT|nr:MAG: hypothetical protein A2627_01970 [Candidatus Woesebacteria bacterium RIFCSPHIGHO2_01_FULL_39_28]OGM56771.1 MAG: hypothetical protein A3A50_04165 [Candidatus Woesebacteria bacterium RIFCSPLOWO2_01_FULL_38_20]